MAEPVAAIACWLDFDGCFNEELSFSSAEHQNTADTDTAAGGDTAAGATGGFRFDAKPCTVTDHVVQQLHHSSARFLQLGTFSNRQDHHARTHTFTRTHLHPRPYNSAR